MNKRPPTLETHVDGWQRFERAVDKAIKSGPKPKIKKKKASSKRESAREKA